VRSARLAQRISQEKLADAVGVSFQQIQKYEKGVNCIGTGRLHAIAKFFDLPVTYFFDGIDRASGQTGLRRSPPNNVAHLVHALRGLQNYEPACGEKNIAFRRSWRQRSGQFAEKPLAIARA